jgi:chromosomal replication initiation ATPase DnaA
VRQATGRDAFFVAAPNALALAEIDRWRDWPSGKLALAGPPGAGKSHLAAVWAAEAGATVMASADLSGAPPLPRNLVVEDADRVAGDDAAERRLLHLHNGVLEAGGRLLLTARAAPARWPVALPDLASRLAATPVARIEAPDDALLSAVLVKLFEDRQLAVTPDLVGYCARRMERSFAAAQALVAALDARALEAGRSPGRRLAAAVLDEMLDEAEGGGP